MKVSQSSDTLRTTPTERKKAKIVYRLVINILKCFRICKKEPKREKNIELQEKTTK